MKEENKITIVCKNPDSEHFEEGIHILKDMHYRIGMQATHIYVDNYGPLKRLGGKYYPVFYDANNFPLCDTSHQPVRHFYEYCSRKPHNGFVYYDYILQSQIDTLEDILSSLIFDSLEIAIHPQPELVKMLDSHGYKYSFI